MSQQIWFRIAKVLLLGWWVTLLHGNLHELSDILPLVFKSVSDTTVLKIGVLPMSDELAGEVDTSAHVGT